MAKDTYITIGKASFHKKTLASISLHSAKEMFHAYPVKHVERAWHEANPAKAAKEEKKTPEDDSPAKK